MDSRRRKAAGTIDYTGVDPIRVSMKRYASPQSKVERGRRNSAQTSRIR